MSLLRCVARACARARGSVLWRERQRGGAVGAARPNPSRRGGGGGRGGGGERETEERVESILDRGGTETEAGSKEAKEVTEVLVEEAAAYGDAADRMLPSSKLLLPEEERDVIELAYPSLYPGKTSNTLACLRAFFVWYRLSGVSGR